MFAAGHLAVGYFIGAITSKLVRRSVNLSLLCFIVILPDLDYLLPEVGRRTITHSLIVQGVLALPFVWKYRQGALPYLFALWAHGFSDLLSVAGVTLFWPVSTYHHPLIPYPMVLRLDPYLPRLEILCTGGAVVMMIATRAWQRLMNPSPWTLLLVGPIVALGGSLAGFHLSTFLMLAQYSFLVLLGLPLLQYGRSRLFPKQSRAVSASGRFEG